LDRMYELKQAHVARAVDVLRAGPMTAAAFALKMWPDRCGGRTPGQHSKMGHGVLRRLGELNYVERVGNMWMVRRFDGHSGSDSATDGASGDHLVAHSIPVASLVGPATESLEERTKRSRLARLVQQATEPVLSVTHDAAFGNLAIRAVAIDDTLVEACAFTVLFGRGVNVYPPCSAPCMLVGLQPAEAARALYLRLSQSGVMPDPPRAGAWIVLQDGIVATPGFWRPSGAPAWWVDPEDVRARVGRLRAAAGLA
jgi:hypothetical protein